mmetsp:Transcript_15273/g.43495  ORF Transcript_15273/g.43495 Transcript_15273/m.43495 type:complete len:284 (+) Transcript_15273:1509-2360(+)
MGRTGTVGLVSSDHKPPAQRRLRPDPAAAGPVPTPWGPAIATAATTAAFVVIGWSVDGSHYWDRCRRINRADPARGPVLRPVPAKADGQRRWTLRRRRLQVHDEQREGASWWHYIEKVVRGGSFDRRGHRIQRPQCLPVSCLRPDVPRRLARPRAVDVAPQPGREDVDSSIQRPSDGAANRRRLVRTGIPGKMERDSGGRQDSHQRRPRRRHLGPHAQQPDPVQSGKREQYDGLLAPPERGRLPRRVPRAAQHHHRVLRAWQSDGRSPRRQDVQAEGKHARLV